jgi:glutamate formiminotransferase / formiminotetrahydrofolate cyclodeaminase
VMGANLNVKINASGLEDKAFVDAALEEGANLEESAQRQESEILTLVAGHL